MRIHDDDFSVMATLLLLHLHQLMARGHSLLPPVTFFTKKYDFTT